MMMPKLWFWDVLGIEPTEDKTVIKQAFSRLAHQISPEDDPDGYGKIHDAYRAALRYVSGQTVPATLKKDINVDKDPDFDFSSVNSTEEKVALDVTEIENTIIVFKKAYGIYSYEQVFNRHQDDLFEVVGTLFKLYSELSDRSPGSGVWTDFLEEPVVASYMDDVAFRDYLKNGLPEEHGFSDPIKEYVSMYEQQLEDRLSRQKKEMEKNREIHKQMALWGYLSAGFAIVSVVYIVVTDSVGYSYYELMATGLFLFAICAYCGGRYFDVVRKSRNGKPRRFSFIIAGLITDVILNALCWVCYFAGAKEAGVFPLIIGIVFTLSVLGVIAIHIVRWIRR